MHIFQDILVYRQGDTFHARGQIDGTEIAAAPRADLVLQSAVDALADGGGAVALQRGVFPLHNPVALPRDVWLRGSGRGTRLLVPPDNAAGVGLLAQDGRGCGIADLAVQATPPGTGVAGVVLDNCGDCHVRDVFVQGFAQYGIWVRNNSFLCALRGCTLADNGTANLYLEHLAQGGRGGDFVPNLVNGCTTYGGGTGIMCDRVIVLNIVGCVVFQPGKYAYHLKNTSNSVLISGCRSFQVEEHAVVVESTHELNVSGNIFCWHRGHGIVLKDVSWGAINGNEFIDQGVRSHDGTLTKGVVLDAGTQGVQVVGNTIFNWGDQCPMQVGIWEDASCKNNLIANNNINFYTEADIVSAGQGTLVKDNVSQGDAAYQGMGRPAYPDFTRDRLSEFLQA